MVLLQGRDDGMGKGNQCLTTTPWYEARSVIVTGILARANDNNLPPSALLDLAHGNCIVVEGAL